MKKNEGKKVHTLNIATDFSEFPFGRYKTDGEHSGEHLRDDVLVPLMRQYDKVIIDLDGLSDSVGSSFFSESFAGLVRKKIFTKDEVLKKLEFVSEREDLIDEIMSYINRF